MEGILPILPCANEVTTGDVGIILSVVVANSVEKVTKENRKFSVGNIDWEFSTEQDTTSRNVRCTFTCQKTTLADYWGINALATMHFTRQVDEGETKPSPVQKIEKVEVNATRRSADIVLSKDELYSLLPVNWNKRNEATYSVHIGVQLKMCKTWGLRRKTIFSYDFFAKNDLSNLLLIIEGKRVFVDLWYLAHYSAFFARYTQEQEMKKLPIDKESNLPRLELKDVTCDAFVDLLKIIYPCQAEVTNDNCEKLLIVANYLGFETVLVKCETFLCGKNAYMSMLKKLQWAFVYQMSDLHEYCIKDISSSQNVVSFKKEEFYKELSCEVKAALLDRLTSLVETEEEQRRRQNGFINVECDINSIKCFDFMQVFVTSFAAQSCHRTAKFLQHEK